MGIGGTVRHDLKRLENALQLHPKEIMAAHQRTINRSASHVRNKAIREMAEGLPGLGAAAIRRQMRLKLASRGSPTAVVQFSEKRFRLFDNFASPGARAGVRLRRLPWRVEALDGEVVLPGWLPHAFFARGRTSGTPNVWIRVGAQRYPITALLASSLATAFRDRGVGPRLLALGRARIAVVFPQEARFRLSKRGLA